MKTLELKLKKDVIIVDIPIDAKNIYLSGNSVVFNTNKSCIVKSLNGNYEFLCKGSELTEEIASEFFEYDDFLNCFEAYIDTVPSIDKSALKLFIKIFESKGFYWLENPVEKPKLKDEFGNKGYYNYEWELEQWQESEEKTFRNPLIFVKK